ncbi:MAG TPA: heavy metal translocating P-type ATPase [Cyclobacteriaceae bacterium]
MKHTYAISGMSCQGCRQKVETALKGVEGVTDVVVDLPKGQAVIDMSSHIELDRFQKAIDDAGGHYTISLPDGSGHGHSGHESGHHHHGNHEQHPDGSHTSHKKDRDTGRQHDSPKIGGVYYCPMHCEGDKTYDAPGSCPVCGMDLVRMPDTTRTVRYTCPMHPEIIRDGPGACPICGMDLVPLDADEEEEDATYKILLRKFRIAAAFTLPIFLIAMSEMIPRNPLPDIMPWKYWNWVQFILSIPVVFYATWMFFERAWRSIVTWHLNMFTLIGIGAGIAWLFSVVALIFPDVFPPEFLTDEGTVYVYFEAATVILTLVLLGQLLEARAHGKTNSAIKELLKLAPSTATRIKDGKEEVVHIGSIHPGDLLRIKPGERIPVDGSIKEGETSIDESMISGEPIPVSKVAGDKVTSGTINGNKTFVMVAEKVGAETLLSRIIEMVNTASRSRAPIQNLADKISSYFVPVVVLIAVITFIVWAIWGPAPSYVYAFVNAVAVLIIACPCALGLATPMSVMVGVGKGAQSGVLIKNAEALERMADIDVVIIDKTGTVTEGKPSVEKVLVAAPGHTEKDVLQKMVSLNAVSEHPLALATVRYGREQGIEPESVVEFEAVTGKGVTGKLRNAILALGNDRLMEQVAASIPGDFKELVQEQQRQGKTVSYLAEGNSVLGAVVISDKIKPTSKVAVERLHEAGLKVVMLTGDNPDTARTVSESLGLDGFKAQMLPHDKFNEVKRLQAEGKKVAMAGDGINDAPALAQADIGIAMGTGTDVAIESAGVTLVKGDLNGIARARLLSHSVMRNIRQNLFFALGYNVLGIPIAAGVLYPAFGLLLSPMIAALAMSFSSVSVIGNSLRLRNARIG